MTIRELKRVAVGVMNTIELIVIANDSKGTQTNVSLRDYETYLKYADYEIETLEQGVYTEYHSEFSKQFSVSVKPKLIIYVYEKGEN